MIARFRRKLNRNGYTKTWNMIRNCKMDQKKRRLENMLTKFTKTRKTHASKAWFSCPVSYGIVVSTFHDLFRLIQNGTQRLSKFRLAGVFFTQSLAGERSKKHPKNNHHKSEKKWPKCRKKWRPKKWFFLVFLGSGVQGAPGWSRRSPRAPSKVKFCWKLYKNGVQNYISMMFL